MNMAMSPVDITAYILVLEALLAVLIVIMAFWTLHETDEDSWLTRAYHLRRAARTRMAKMLEQHGIAPRSYLQQLPIPELRRQIDTCRHCELKPLCDGALSSAALTGPGASFSFCPNRTAINAQLQAT